MSNLGPSSVQSINSQALLNNDAIQLLFILRGANMRSTQDQQFTRMFNGITFDPQFITAVWKSGAFSSACAGGVYPAINKGGTGIVSSVQSYAGLTGALKHVNCLIQATTTTFTDTPYVSLTTANSADLLADFYIYGFCYDQ